MLLVLSTYSYSHIDVDIVFQFLSHMELFLQEILKLISKISDIIPTDFATYLFLF